MLSCDKRVAARQHIGDVGDRLLYSLLYTASSYTKGENNGVGLSPPVPVHFLAQLVSLQSGLTSHWTRDRPKFGFGYGAETGGIFSFGYGRNREARFRPTFGYGRNYDKVSGEGKLSLLVIR